MRAVVFDFDGVLADSESLHYETLRDTLADHGVVIDEREYRDTLLAHDDREALRIAFERHEVPFDLDRIEQAARDKSRRFEALLDRVALLPGARGLVESLAREVPVAIASGALTSEIERILEGTGLARCFATIVGADQVARGKPDPAPYAEAVARLAAETPDLRAEHCLAFEDSIAGVASARVAGLRVVAVAGSFPAERLGSAHHVLESLEGLDAAAARRLHAG